jgi:RNA polymerase sigma factor (sigma-70 family)
VAQPSLTRVARTLRASVRPKATAPESDGELLVRFADAADPEAFRALVARHGKAVLAACRQVLADPADVDDAFQATFLVLLKKAKALDASAPLGGWLFAVAHRVAVRCRSDARRRQSREAEAASRRRQTIELPDLSWREAVAVLHDELNGLPDKYRLPLLLCSVQGLTRDEAAEQLGSTVGAVRGQLERGRSLLERRLTRRGIVLSAGLLAVLVGSSRAAGGPSAELIDLALRSAGGQAPSAVAALAHGAFPMTAFWKQILLPAVLLVGLAGVGLGVGAWHASAAANAQKPKDKMERPAAKADAKEATPKEDVKERTVTGKVVGPDGKPVQADLLYCWIEGKTESLGKTKADGTFRVTVRLKSPGAFLVAKAKGYGIDFMMPATNTPAEVTFELPKDQPIRGRLIDPQGKPVAGAAVQLRTVKAFAGGSAQPFLDAWKKRTYFRQQPLEESKGLYNVTALPVNTTTDRDGRFEMAGVGAERLVSLKISGAGRAEVEVHVVTRAGFDPKPYNDATLGLKPKYGEKLSWSFNPMLSAPDFSLAVEPEKLVRGRLTDAKTGKPRPGVEVTMAQDDGLARHYPKATTDQEGRFVLRGAKKWPTYQLAAMADDAGGYLPSEVQVKDTVGYEPVVADIACQKGVVITGTIRDKSTGLPVAGGVHANVLADNTHLKDYPDLGRFPTFGGKHIKGGGAYRVVVIPGPVLLVGRADGHGGRDVYKLARPDPKHPRYFHTEFKALGYYGPGGGRGFVDGNWCKVIEAKGTDTVLKQDIELEPAARKAVGVVGPDGKPVPGVHATGISPREFHFAEPIGDTATITLVDLEPKQERLVVAMHRGRKLVGAAVVKGSDGNPVVRLGPGGTAKGRVVNQDGKPLAGITVKLYFDRREVAEVYSPVNENRQAVTGADGAFEFDNLLPGYEFRLLFSKGKKEVGPEYRNAPTHKVGKHGETLRLGDFKPSPADGDSE